MNDTRIASKEGRDVLVNGCHGRMVAACRIEGRKTMPLALRLHDSTIDRLRGESLGHFGKRKSHVVHDVVLSPAADVSITIQLRHTLQLD